MKIMRIVAVFLVVTVCGAFAGVPVNYTVGGDLFEGYMEKGLENAPLVLLVHDWDGLTNYEMKRAGMLAEMGYSGFCADLFGAGVRPEKLEDRQKCTGELDADRPKMRVLLQGALAAATVQGLNTDNCVAMGYCFGGTAVLEFARSGVDLKGWATFHGGLALPEGQDYSKTKGQVLALHGSADRNVNMEQFMQMAEDLEKAGVPNEMITYGGAPHAWTVLGSGAYREDADKKSWRRFAEFLTEILK